MTHMHIQLFCYYCLASNITAAWFYLVCVISFKTTAKTNRCVSKSGNGNMFNIYDIFGNRKYSSRRG